MCRIVRTGRTRCAQTVRRMCRMTDMDEHLRWSAAAAAKTAGRCRQAAVRIRIGWRTAWTAAADTTERRACADIQKRYCYSTCLKRCCSTIVLPECVVVAVVMYLELGLCLLLLSNQLSTSRTACGFFFCSCLLMFEFISKRAQASGMPCLWSSSK